MPYNSNSLLPPMPGQWNNNNSMFNWGSSGGAWGDPNMQQQPGFGMNQALGTAGMGYNPMGGMPPLDQNSIWGNMNQWWGDNGQMVGGMLGGLNTLGGMYSGLKNLKMQKDQFKFQKNAYNENMAMQKQDLNRKLGANWRDMEASGNTGNYQSLEDYLGKNQFA